MKHAIGFAIITLFLIPVSVFAAGDAPRGYQPVQGTGIFSVFSTGTLGQGRWSLETGAEIVKDPDVERLPVRAAYGVANKLDVGMNLSAASVEGGDGLEDLSLGVKYRFLDQGRYGPSAALILALSLPTGEEVKNLGSGAFESEAVFVASRRVGPFTGHFNLGYNIIYSSDNDDELIAAGGLDFSASKNVVLLSEIYFKSSRNPLSSSLLEARLGYRARLSESISSSVGLGFGLDSREPEYRVMVLFTFNYPRDSEIIRMSDQ